MEYLSISKIVTAAILIVAMSLTGALIHFTKQAKIQDTRLQQELKSLNITTDQQKQDLQKQLDEQSKQIEKLKTDVQAKAESKRLAAIEAAKPSLVAQLVNYIAPVALASQNGSESAKMFIYNHESGNRPGAINPSSGACGIGQALPCSKLPCSLTDYACQDTWFSNYMLSRYGTWENAKAFWIANSWW